MAAPWLAELERRASDDPAGVAAALAFVAGRDVGVDGAELHAAVRRAVLVLAAGGDPHRALGFDDRSVETLAADLANPGRTDALGRRLADLDADADGLPAVRAVLAELRADPDLSWRALACALLMDEVDDDG